MNCMVILFYFFRHGWLNKLKKIKISFDNNHVMSVLCFVCIFFKNINGLKVFYYLDLE